MKKLSIVLLFWLLVTSCLAQGTSRVQNLLVDNSITFGTGTQKLESVNGSLTFGGSSIGSSSHTNVSISTYWSMANPATGTNYFSIVSSHTGIVDIARIEIWATNTFSRNCRLSITDSSNSAYFGASKLIEYPYVSFVAVNPSSSCTNGQWLLNCGSFTFGDVLTGDLVEISETGRVWRSRAASVANTNTVTFTEALPSFSTAAIVSPVRVYRPASMWASNNLYIVLEFSGSGFTNTFPLEIRHAYSK